MSKEELSNIQELIERKKFFAEVGNGLTSSDKKFIDLWNYTIDLKTTLDEIRDNIQNSIDSINDRLSDKEIRVENGIIVNPINDYRIVRLKAIRMKCKELLQILDKVKE